MMAPVLIMECRPILVPAFTTARWNMAVPSPMVADGEIMAEDDMMTGDVSVPYTYLTLQTNRGVAAVTVFVLLFTIL